MREQKQTVVDKKEQLMSFLRDETHKAAFEKVKKELFRFLESVETKEAGRKDKIWI